MNKATLLGILLNKNETALGKIPEGKVKQIRVPADEVLDLFHRDPMDSENYLILRGYINEPDNRTVASEFEHQWVRKMYELLQHDSPDEFKTAMNATAYGPQSEGIDEFAWADLDEKLYIPGTNKPAVDWFKRYYPAFKLAGRFVDEIRDIRGVPEEEEAAVSKVDKDPIVMEEYMLADILGNEPWPVVAQTFNMLFNANVYKEFFVLDNAERNVSKTGLVQEFLAKNLNKQDDLSRSWTKLTGLAATSFVRHEVVQDGEKEKKKQTNVTRLSWSSSQFQFDVFQDDKLGWQVQLVPQSVCGEEDSLHRGQPCPKLARQFLHPWALPADTKPETLVPAVLDTIVAKSIELRLTGIVWSPGTLVDVDLGSVAGWQSMQIKRIHTGRFPDIDDVDRKQQWDKYLAETFKLSADSPVFWSYDVVPIGDRRTTTDTVECVSALQMAPHGTRTPGNSRNSRNVPGDWISNPHGMILVPGLMLFFKDPNGTTPAKVDNIPPPESQSALEKLNYVVSVGRAFYLPRNLKLDQALKTLAHSFRLLVDSDAKLDSSALQDLQKMDPQSSTLPKVSITARLDDSTTLSLELAPLYETATASYPSLFIQRFSIGVHTLHPSVLINANTIQSQADANKIVAGWMEVAKQEELALQKRALKFSAGLGKKGPLPASGV